MSKDESLRTVRSDSGFSLIEVIVVVAVILIIGAIAVPRLMQARAAANEASAASSLRVISQMQIHYQTSFGLGFAPSLDALGPPISGQQPSATAAGLIDSVLASGIKNGYSFVYVPIDTGNGIPLKYTMNANPISPGQTGDRYFYLDETNVIRWKRDGPADRTSPPLPN